MVLGALARHAIAPGTRLALQQLAASWALLLPPPAAPAQASCSPVQPGAVSSWPSSSSSSWGSSWSSSSSLGTAPPHPPLPLQPGLPSSCRCFSSADSQQQQRRQPGFVTWASVRQQRARLFGQPIPHADRTGRRVLARRLQGAELASWYFNPPTVPGIHNEEREYVLLRKKNKRTKKAEDDEGKAKGKK